MNNQYLPVFLASCLFFISLSQTASNTSSQYHCLPDQSAHLLQLRQEFVERNYSDYYVYYEYYDYCYHGSYPKMKSWKADSDCCSWDGVTCDTQNGEVIGLDLSKSWLYGPLNSNSSLFSLRHLRKLNLDSNNFSSSTIPPEFGQLVRRIDLEALVQNMAYLRELHLGEVNISSSLPQSLANFSSLTSLSLSGCNLQGKFPSDIFMLPKIQAIDLSFNPKLVGFLPKFQSRSTLKELRLPNTNFSGELPNSMDNLGSLNVLDLSGTNLFGELPNSISNLKSLNYLGLDSSNFSGAIPPSIGNLSQLTHLSLSYNNFHGQLPSTLGNLAKLTSLELNNILHSQEVPYFLGNLTQLEFLSLSHNNFDCGFPIWLTNNTKLRSIDFWENQLKGPIPSEIGRLPNLSYLDLSYNSLTEAIPSVLFTTPSLSTLSLYHNQLTGPLKFQNISTSPLKVLDLGENKLNESIPRSIANFTKLQGLYLSSINLKGKVELDIFFELKELQSLDLSVVKEMRK
ncbi:hypothetical protein CMV_002714 [Castanea mollissima]|uniref:Leucine-rich repeat-containing N-terminal plant-type domain-containing protein n=1 Tax=Castanea mollissima TaxID=60419 RepID=A0A8J4RVK1_9ROSI|nr:hypothetical protein CMV_002714 [Castanea mollissima]